LPGYRLTRSALSDLHSIAAYTLRNWGEAQMRRYIAGFYGCLEMLPGNPALGRTCDSIHPGLRRMEHEKHVVFYRQQPDASIRTIRILHQSRLPDRSRFPK